VNTSFFRNDCENNFDYRGNSVLNFFEDCVTIDSKYYCSTKQLYRYYLEHWSLNSHKENIINFVKEIKKQFGLNTKRKWVNHRTYYPTVLIGCFCEADYKQHLFLNCKIEIKKYNHVSQLQCLISPQFW
jgi:hypothetical protein